MLQLLLYPLLLFVWNWIGNYMYIRIDSKSFKLSRTHVSAIHASSVILAYLLGIPGYILYYWSITYYILDSMYEIVGMIDNNKGIRLFDFGMLLHHFISIAMLKHLCYPGTEKYLYKAFYLAEVSNLPMYMVYHLKVLEYKNKYLTKTLIAIEALGFIVLRLILGGTVTIELVQIDDVSTMLKISAVIMLIISAVWANKLVRQVLS